MNSQYQTYPTQQRHFNGRQFNDGEKKNRIFFHNLFFQLDATTTTQLFVCTWNTLSGGGGGGGGLSQPTSTSSLYVLFPCIAGDSLLSPPCRQNTAMIDFNTVHQFHVIVGDHSINSIYQGLRHHQINVRTLFVYCRTNIFPNIHYSPLYPLLFYSWTSAILNILQLVKISQSSPSLFIWCFKSTSPNICSSLTVPCLSPLPDSSLRPSAQPPPCLLPYRRLQHPAPVRPDTPRPWRLCLARSPPHYLCNNSQLFQAVSLHSN